MSFSTPPIDLSVHHAPGTAADRFALAVTKLLRWCADTFFAKRYGHRAIVLETVAAVPGMVGATLTHLRCLRRLEEDRGWIRTLMEEAENERMHLMTFIEVAQPTLFERIVILTVQWVFYLGFSLLYLLSPRTAHRLVGYFEEEAVVSYTLYLAEIDAGRVPNIPAPAIARTYWGLPASATLRDVVLAVRADEAHHRDVNHGLAAELGGARPAGHPSPYPWHASTTTLTRPAPGPYRVTVDFTPDNLPAALQKEHKTAQGVWGVIRVKEGSLRLTHLDSGQVELLDPQTPGHVTPLSPHFISPAGPFKVCVEFYDHDPRGQ
jgi:ubiquinol oxidase